MGISVVLLAYKEEENLRMLLPQIRRQVEQCGEEYEILVVDTAQPMDNTREVCEQQSARYVNQEHPGFGGAFRTGIQYAQMDKFLIMDSDGSHNPKYIPDLYRLYISGADMVIGSRYVKGGKTNDGWFSVLLSRVLNTVFRLCLGVKAKDISTDFRMYDTASLKAIELECVNYDVLEEVILKLRLRKDEFVIKETPITFEKRVFGDSKRNLFLFMFSYGKTLFRLAKMRFSSALRSEKQQQFLRQMVLYGAFGLLAAGVDFGVFTLINYLTGAAVPVVANIAGAFTGFLVSFVGNTAITFKKRDKLLARVLAYFSICLVGMGVSSGIIYLLQGVVNLSLLKLLAMGVVAVMQFLLNRHITYKN